MAPPHCALTSWAIDLCYPGNPPWPHATSSSRRPHLLEGRELPRSDGTPRSERSLTNSLLTALIRDVPSSDPSPIIYPRGTSVPLPSISSPPRQRSSGHGHFVQQGPRSSSPGGGARCDLRRRRRVLHQAHPPQPLLVPGLAARHR
jgi:hypothetical protein